MEQDSHKSQVPTPSYGLEQRTLSYLMIRSQRDVSQVFVFFFFFTQKSNKDSFIIMKMIHADIQKLQQYKRIKK